MSTFTICPASKPQELFLNLRDGTGKRSKYANEDGEEVDIIFYGGQAGGGKSFASLMHHMKYIHIPHYKGIIIRRTTPMLTKPGAIWDEARALYKEVDPKARIRMKDMKINFGPVQDSEQRAEVSFTHFERVDDTDNFQGSQLSSAVLDELCQFEESQFLYILSRLRTKANMKPVMRATMNPDPDSWVKKYVGYYLYPPGHEFFGRPDPEKQGKVRWFIRDGNEMMWTESREDMFEKYGRRDSDGVLLDPSDKKQIKPLSFSFLSASVYDNPYIDDNYIAFLEGLPRVQKEILLYGSWEARPEGNQLVKRDWFRIEDAEPPWTDIVKTVRAFDWAGTKKSETNPSPDYSATTRMSLLRDGTYFIHDVQRARILFGEWRDWVLQVSANDKQGTDILLPIDPNPASRGATALLARELSTYGKYVRTIKATGKKIDRFRPFASMCMNGGIRILKDCGTDYENDLRDTLSFVFKEVEAFDGQRRSGENGHDDVVDTFADAFITLAQKKEMPNITAALASVNLTTNNPFSGR